MSNVEGRMGHDWPCSLFYSGNWDGPPRSDGTALSKPRVKCSQPKLCREYRDKVAGPKFYAVPVSSMGNFKTDWRIVIAVSEGHARGNTEESLEMHEFISGTLKIRWLGPAHAEDLP